ncbi:hypothetical protein TNIN_263611 [Trichonephila inaurata madagascariensis]|uniref:Uncharacterized protein n=1 Tax=Trichonephila inaurata madagascariensis TaxID=2747483 RepID=A0A8X6IFP3_9ARAC|nr:hypothetical protein TNIN_263541 [Trichonephila inaurata madagascariensis]GFS43195.1 hypothetical protein TNIN_263611 [Trichonephila inaurata madagascariensis]
MLTGFRATARPSDPSLTPTAGNDTSRKVSFLPPLLLFRCSLQHLELALWCFNLHTKASTGSMRGHSGHTLNPFTEQRKGVNPVRERPLKLIAEVAYIKVAPVSGCVR